MLTIRTFEDFLYEVLILLISDPYVWFMFFPTLDFIFLYPILFIRNKRELNHFKDSNNHDEPYLRIF